MAIMAQGCCIAVIHIKTMNWSAICWYQLYLIVTHHRSHSIGHGVSSCRKYSLKNHVMARPSGIMQSQVSINPNRNLQKGTLTPKPRLGRPRQSTLEDGRQLLQSVRNGRTTSASASHGSSPQTYPYPDGWSTTGWFKQNIINSVPGGNLCRAEINAITDIAGMGAQQLGNQNSANMWS